MRRLCAVLLMCLALPSLGFEWQGRLTHITREFDSADATRRRDLLRMLSGYGAEEVRALLLHALEDADPTVRQEAADAAGRMHLRAATSTLVEWLVDPDVPTRISAVRALGRIADPGSTTQLVRALGDADADVRRAAVVALGSIGTRDVVVPLLGRLDDLTPEVRIDACSMLARIRDSRAVVPLIGRAHDNTPEVRTAVFRALGELSDRRALTPLVQALRDDADESRIAAITALGALRDPGAVDALVALLETHDQRVSRATLSALGWIGGERATRAIVREITANDGSLQSVIAVLVSLVERTPEQAGRAAIVQEILSTLDEAGPVEVRAIAQALQELAAVTSIEESVPLLLRKLADQRGDLPQLEITLAASGDPRALLPLLERLHSTQAGSLRATVRAITLYFQLREPDGRAADPLLDALGRVDRDTRADVVKLLGQVGARRAIPAIRPFVEATERPLRLAAVTALGSIGDAEGATLLLPLLSDRDAEIRTRAADAVGRAASADVLRELMRRFASDAPVDRGAIGQAIGIAVAHLRETSELTAELRDSARDTLLRGTSASDTRLAALSIDALGQANDPAFSPSLVDLLAHGQRSVRPGAARALGRQTDDASHGALLAALSDRDIEVSMAAAEALASSARSADSAELIALVAAHSWPLSANAAYALARMAGRGVLAEVTAAHLCPLLTSRDPYTRANILAALGAMHAPRCSVTGAAEPLSWLSLDHSPVVRAAAARWVHALTTTDAEHATAYREGLSRCAEADPSLVVAAACRNAQRVPVSDSFVDVTVYRASARSLHAGALVAVRFADGTYVIQRADENAHIRVWNAVRGDIGVGDPLSLELEGR